MSEYEVQQKRGMPWLGLTLVFALVAAIGLSIAAYFFSDPQLTVGESIGAGFGGVAALIVGIFGAIIGLLFSLIGAAIGIITAGGALAVTLFIVGSPIIAIILLFLLMRRRSRECPDPSVH